MNSTEYLEQSGPFEARYLAFLEAVAQLRPSLHRYCARMVGSVMDGEDVVQETLFEAYRKLDKFDDTRLLKPWLFRIAHNRCIDFLRSRGVRDEAETAAAMPEAIAANEPVIFGVGSAVEHLVSTLPPKERACVLLAEIDDYGTSRSLGAAMPRNTTTARFSRTMSSSARRPTRSPTRNFGTVVILSTIIRHPARSPLISLGSTGNRNNGASVGSVVKAQIVIESVASKRSSCRITAGRGFPA